MDERCTQCLAGVPERLRYETPRGETLCGPCYFALWGPRGQLPLSSRTEAGRPRSQRPPKPRMDWMVPGPSGELDRRAPKRRGGRRR